MARRLHTTRHDTVQHNTTQHHSKHPHRSRHRFPPPSLRSAAPVSARLLQARATPSRWARAVATFVRRSEIALPKIALPTKSLSKIALPKIALSALLGLARRCGVREPRSVSVLTHMHNRYTNKSTPYSGWGSLDAVGFESPEVFLQLSPAELSLPTGDEVAAASA